MTPSCRLIRLLVAYRKLVIFVIIVYVIGLWCVYGRYSPKFSVQVMNNGVSTALQSAPALQRLFGGGSVDDNVLVDETEKSFVSSNGISSEGHVLIAIGGGITSKGVRLSTSPTTDEVKQQFVFFTTLLPTFCRTASPSSKRVSVQQPSATHVYIFYLAHDHDDQFFNNDRSVSFFRQVFSMEVERLCRSVGVPVANLKLVKCRHSGSPAWAQNDAMMSAYLDGAEYFYRVNDDTKMVSTGWTEKFIKVLENYKPRNVGVVGPNHQGGNVGILTYDFVHRSHIEIFGCYYPRVFSDWYGDSWITRVYKPGRSTKVSDVRLAHTMILGRRYKLAAGAGQKLGPRLEKDKSVLDRFVKASIVRQNNSMTSSTTHRRLIALALYSQDILDAWGAIRNAQLVPIFLPDWQLRVYVPDTHLSHRLNTSGTISSESKVLRRVIVTLERLGAQVVPFGDVAPPSLEVVVSEPNVDYFLVRQTTWRLSAREAAAVREWVQTAETGGHNESVVHCMHDHVNHSRQALVNGLWGFRPSLLQRILKTSNTTLMTSSITAFPSMDSGHLLNSIVWPLVSGLSYCHNNERVPVCHEGPSAGSIRPFPIGRQPNEAFIGQPHDECSEPLETKSLMPCNEVAASSAKTTRSM